MFLKSEGGKFYKRNPFERNFWKKLKFLLKKVKLVNFIKEIPLKKFYENIKILLKLEKKFKKGLF